MTRQYVEPITEAQLIKAREEIHACLIVKRSGRFITKQKLWIFRQRPCDRKARKPRDPHALRP